MPPKAISRFNNVMNSVGGNLWNIVRMNVGISATNRAWDSVRGRVQNRVWSIVRDDVDRSVVSSLENTQRIPLNVMISALKSVEEAS
jgi:hypothetical protein